jgi:hypothetical protein
VARSGTTDTSILAVQVAERPLDRQRCPRGTLGVVLERERIAEQRHQPVTELLATWPHISITAAEASSR